MQDLPVLHTTVYFPDAIHLLKQESWFKLQLLGSSDGAASVGSATAAVVITASRSADTRIVTLRGLSLARG